MKPKTIYLYVVTNQFTYQSYENCTNVTYDGPVLSFTDANGTRHITSVPWEIEQ